jgi:hypothetical protein
VLSAAYLNSLSSNQAFLFGVANNANTPFNSFRAVHVTLDSSKMEWFLRHRVPWLHWRVISLGSPWNYARIYYNGVKVGQSTAGASSWTGSFNLSSWAGLPNLVGAWGSGVAYNDDVGGDGDNGNGDDGSVVTVAAAYYRCKLAHTSAAGNQPGVGGSWTTYWDLLTLPTVGAICGTWADVNFSAGVEVGVDYIVETDSPSF